MCSSISVCIASSPPDISDYFCASVRTTRWNSALTVGQRLVLQLAGMIKDCSILLPELSRLAGLPKTESLQLCRSQRRTATCNHELQVTATDGYRADM